MSTIQTNTEPKKNKPKPSKTEKPAQKKETPPDEGRLSKTCLPTGATSKIARDKHLIQMETLAQAGLTLDEILAHDNWTDPPPALLQAMEEAVRRGRLLGAAAIKRVRHQAALNGNTSAQAHQLALLTAEDEPGGVTVERVILHGEA